MTKESEQQLPLPMKEAESDEIKEQDSPSLTRNLLRIAIFNISDIRGLFPKEYFKDDESVSALDVEIKELMPRDAESRGLIDWMEKGVYDPLQRKYLKTLMFCICETEDGPMIEAYAFSFSYSDSDSQSVTMNIKRTGGTFNYTADITPNEMSSACKMVRTLIQRMTTLDKIPDQRTIMMKLMYYNDVTPQEYELPFLIGCAEEEAQYEWTENPLRMEAGDVNLVLTLKVKSGESSSSKMTGRKYVAKLPSKPCPSLLVMGEILNKRIRIPNHMNRNQLLHAGLQRFGNVWKTMPEADKASYHKKAEELNGHYKKNLEYYNIWTSMSKDAQSPFIEKVKASHKDKIVEAKKMMETWQEKLDPRYDEVFDDWLQEETEKNKGRRGFDFDENNDFDRFGFILFCQASQESFLVFRNGFMNLCKEMYPTAQLGIQDASGWWHDIPECVAERAVELWNESTDAQKAGYYEEAKARIFSLL